jgi:hypothetical protein
MQLHNLVAIDQSDSGTVFLAVEKGYENFINHTGVNAVPVVGHFN